MSARRGSGLGAALLAIVLFGGCRKAPGRDCEEFRAAQKVLDEISLATLDPTFGDPRYQRALSAFEAIPKDCEQHQTAATIAETIRAAMAQRRTESAAAAVPPPPPPAAPSAPAPVSGGDERELAKKVAAYFEEMDAAEAGPDGTDGQAYTQQLMMEGFQQKGDFSRLLEFMSRVESNYRSISPPEPCAEYHRVELEGTAQVKSLVQDLQSAIAAKDEAKLEALRGRETEIKASHAKLLQMRRDLARRYRISL